MDTNRTVSDTNTRQSIRVGILFTVVVLGAIGLWIFFGFGPRLFFNDWDSSGTFGDTFGSANALFSGLAFAGVIWAIVLQKKELQLQREQLQRSVQVQEESQRAFKRQADSAETLTQLNVLNVLHGFYDEQAKGIGGGTKGSPELAKYMTYLDKRKQCRTAIDRFYDKFVESDVES